MNAIAGQKVMHMSLRTPPIRETVESGSNYLGHVNADRKGPFLRLLPEKVYLGS